jgi:hypothetical protein
MILDKVFMWVDKAIIDEMRGGVTLDKYSKSMNLQLRMERLNTLSCMLDILGALKEGCVPFLHTKRKTLI